MRTLIKENTWLARALIDFGWGNGYVLIPEGHPLHGMHYDNIDVDVHGGLTFSELVDAKLIEKWGELTEADKGMWMIGFDTSHYRDNLYTCPKEYVEAEAERLLGQVKNYEVEAGSNSQTSCTWLMKIINSCHNSFHLNCANTLVNLYKEKYGEIKYTDELMDALSAKTNMILIP